jgi:Leucine-rich repeat (LRR) protein
MDELTIVGWVVSPLIKRLSEKALAYAKDQYKWLKGPTDSLERLTSSLTRIQAASRSVERHQHQTQMKDPDHEAWIQQLKDAVYEIDDVLDEFTYLALKSGIQPKVSRALFNSGRTVKRIFGMDKPITKLKSLLQRLDAIEESYKSLVGVATLEALGAVHHADPVGVGSLGPLLIGSVPTEDAMIGRDVEYQDLVSRLTESSGQCHADPVPVVAVVGDAGMGKTTIAQFAFNDSAVEKCFEMMMWVSVPEKFDEVNLIREIINSAENEKCVSTLNFGGLQQVLKKMVNSKKFLLVLDNVCHEDNEIPLVTEKWKNVLAPLRFANRAASRILVTTQMIFVPKIFNSIDPLCLHRLTDSDEWSVLKMFALGDRNSKANKELEIIGRQIADKLGGSPLAAKIVGGMLRAKPTREFWKEIYSNKDMYNNSISTVKASFAKLSEQLQRCFAYCSIFPRNWRFDRKKLVNMWIAHDFIEPRGGEQMNLEELGLEYFNELKRKSFFESLNPGRRTYYVIHDTVYDVALSVSATECIRIEGDQSKNVPRSIRHLSVSTDRLLQLQNQCELKRLRTLVVLKNNSHLLKKIEEVLIKESNSLRVLDISDSDVTVLPENVGRMMHLRYLALCKTINLVPQSIVDLLHLQTLYIPRECKIEKLPNGINKLINMRQLVVDSKCIAEISYIGGMVNLNCSVEFHVKNDDGHKLEELQNIDKINGKLTIKNLENVMDGKESGKANLKKKDCVKVLNLEWSPGSRNRPCDVEVEVLENLEPHPNLQELHIMRYCGNKSPQWLEKGVLHNLKKIYLINCRRWQVLPPLGHLPALKILHVKEMYSVKQVGPDFYGNYEEAFPNLQELEFDDMPQWSEWSPDVNSLSFPKLKKIKISNCPKLVKVPPVPVTVTAMEAKRNGFVSYLKLRPYHSSKPDKLFLETSTLVIFDELLCDEHAKYIQVLTICQCEEPVKIGARYKALASVERLRICQSRFVDDELKILLQDMKALVTLEIIDCPRIETLQLAGEENVLEELHVENCKMFSSLISLKCSPSLQIMIIETCPKFTSASLPSDLNTLLSLKKISILHCPGFQSLPNDGFPQSLHWFELIGCDQNLTNSLYERRGSDWEKISSVLNVQIRY